jgi:hypothetical protein
MDLFGHVGPGRRSEGAIAELRPLTDDDLVLLAAPREAERQPLKQLRHKHHALARALANGLSEGEAGIVAGFTPSTVTVLKTDPSFAELVRFYEGENARTFDAINEKIVGVTVAALDEALERFENEPEKVPFSIIKELIQLGADRTGHGPSTTQNLNVNIGLADRMAAAQKRLDATRHEPPPSITYSDISE